MNRLKNLECQLVSAKATLDFDYFAKLPSLDRLDFKKRVYGPNWQWRQRMINIIENNPHLFHHYHLEESSRQERRQKVAISTFMIRDHIKITLEDYMRDPNILTLVSNAVLFNNLGLSVKNGVHLYLYMKALLNLGTERHQKFIEDASMYQQIGCFALTELTHGSDVKNLRTQAHYDHQNRQFIVNTPSKEAMKFWIGAAAEVADISVVWAQLYIAGKCYGIHAFVVPLRNRKTHQTLPGVVIGDCGPKNGNNQIDNGFILFDKVRIPAANLLNRVSGVDENGKFYSTVKGEDKRFGIHLGALSGGRFMVSLNSSSAAVSAISIATHYACIRRQFSDPKATVENLLIEYPLTKRRLMPLLAQSVIYQMGNMDAAFEWDKNHKKILEPQNDVMEDLHAVSSVLKPKSSWFASEAIKEARQILGGHGYSSFSKLGTLYNDNDVQTTWQGDNNVLIQQATKYVLENAQKALKGKPVTSKWLGFLANPPSDSDISYEEEKLLDLNYGLTFIQYKIFCKVQDTGMKMLALKQQKMPILDIWNSSQVFLGKPIALAFGDLYYLQNAIDKISQFSQKNQPIFKMIIQVWVLRIIRNDELTDSVHHPVLQKLISQLSAELVKESLGILEAICPSDRVIGSPFACPKGQGFQKYIKMVRESNTENKRVQWWEILKK